MSHRRSPASPHGSTVAWSWSSRWQPLIGYVWIDARRMRQPSHITPRCRQDHLVADHQHDHDHDHDHHHDHDHRHDRGWLERVRHLVAPHSHDTVDKVDAVLETSRDGLRALWLSLLILGVTAALQAVIVAWSGSVA